VPKFLRLLRTTHVITQVAGFEDIISYACESLNYVCHPLFILKKIYTIIVIWMGSLGYPKDMSSVWQTLQSEQLILPNILISLSAINYKLSASLSVIRCFCQKEPWYKKNKKETYISCFLVIDFSYCKIYSCKC
jgi:hypothetical protein